MGKTFVSLLSGVDSFVATQLCINKGMIGEAFYFEYGQPHEEVLAVSKLATTLSIPLNTADIAIEILRKDSAPYYPFRNSILITTVANMMVTRSDIKTIITGLGTVSSSGANGYPDTSTTFTSKLLDSLNEGVYPEDEIEILNPVMGWSRIKVFKWLFNNGFKRIIKNTSSCYEDGQKRFPWGVGCGICDHCAARQTDVEAAYESQED